MKKFLSSLVLAVFLLSQTQPAMANAYSTPGAFSGIGSDVRAEYFNGKHDPQLSPRIKIEKIYGDKLRGEGKVFCTLFKNRKDGKRYFAVAASSSVIKSGNKLEDSRRRFGRLKWSVAAKSPGKSYDVLRIDYPKKFTAPFIGTGLKLLYSTGMSEQPTMAWKIYFSFQLVLTTEIHLKGMRGSIAQGFNVAF
jgi:hypothetical protein